MCLISLCIQYKKSIIYFYHQNFELRKLSTKEILCKCTLLWAPDHTCYFMCIFKFTYLFIDWLLIHYVIIFEFISNRILHFIDVELKGSCGEDVCYKLFKCNFTPQFRASYFLWKVLWITVISFQQVCQRMHKTFAPEMMPMQKRQSVVSY